MKLEIVMRLLNLRLALAVQTQARYFIIHAISPVDAVVDHIELYGEDILQRRDGQRFLVRQIPQINTQDL